MYHAAGWHGALPLGRVAGRKYPPPEGWTGHDAPYPSAADVAAWQESHADRNIGLRLPPGVIGLDVDAYPGKRGGESLAQLEAKFGALPPTWVTTARTDGVSGIRLYRAPTELDGKPINWPGEAGKHIEIIQRGHRYAVVWPSTNPEADGAQYQWRLPSGEWCGLQSSLVRMSDDPVPHPSELAELPDAWVRGLALPYDRTEKADLGTPEAQAWWRALRPAEPSPCPVVATVTARALVDLRDVDGSRHETARDAAAALARLGGEGHRGAAEALGQVAKGFAEAVGEARAVAGGEWQRLIVGAVKLAAAANRTPRQHCEHDAATELVVPADLALSFPEPGSVTTPDADPGALTLPETFWAARESLAKIRQAAHSRVRSGDVVLYGLLARLAAMAPHTLRADTGIGTPASLNLFAAIVGPSGAGKSSGLSVSRELVKAERPPEEFPLGSGEGIAEAYMGEAEVGTGQMKADGSEKLQKVRKQVRHNVLFHSDEGQSLTKLIERSGSTVGETLRSAWSGEGIGQKNGRAETTRTVPARSYAAGLVIGFQPSTALPLLADVDAGTPQRFLYCWAIDPTIPGRQQRVPWPGELSSPFPPDVPTDLPAPGAIVAAPTPRDIEPITFAEEILDELYETEHAKNTGALPADHPLRDKYRSQHPVMRVKIASLLALLESRRRVDRSDWDLAQVLIDTSDRVRAYLQALADAAAREEARRADEAHARRAVMAHAAVGQHELDRASLAVSRLAAAVTRKVHAAGESGLMRSAARKTVASSSRPLFGDAVALAVEMAWVVEDGGRLRPGASLPVGD